MREDAFDVATSPKPLDACETESMLHMASQQPPGRRFLKEIWKRIPPAAAQKHSVGQRANHYMDSETASYGIGESRGLLCVCLTRYCFFTIIHRDYDLFSSGCIKSTTSLPTSTGCKS